MKIVKTVLAGLLLGGTALAGTAAWIYGDIPVERHSSLFSPALQGDVTVERDQAGVPHIFGDHSTDILFASGYTQMQDRMLQFEIFRRVAAGELSEIFGKDTLEADIFARKSAYSDTQKEEMLAQMSPDHRAHMKAMVAGINHYVSQAKANPGTYLPLEFSSLDIPLRHYTEGDIIDVGSVSARIFGATGGYELKNLRFLKDMIEQHGEENGRQIFNDVLVLNDPDAYAFGDEGTEVYQATLPTRFLATDKVLEANQDLALATIEQGQQAFKTAMHYLGLDHGASRTLVVSKDRSASGNILMMQATADGYEVHLSGGGLESTGLSMVSAGAPVMGRGDGFGWLITTAERDTIDTYTEELNPDNPHQYRFNGIWRDMKVRKETIRVADGDPVTIDVATTIHGPVMEWDKDNNRAWSRKWAAWMTEGKAWGVFLDISRARTLEDFRAIIFNARHSSLNVTIGTEDGHIETWQVGDRPIRPDSIDPRLPTPGTGAYEWLGFEAQEDAANLANPERGYTVVWNNKAKADMTYGDGARWGKHFRTWLPLSLLERDDNVTIDDLKDINKTLALGWASVDLKATSPAFFAPFLKEAAETATDRNIRAMVDQMTSWDGLYLDQDADNKYDHAGLPLFNLWLETARDVIFGDEMGNWVRDIEKDVYIKYSTSLLLRVLEGDQAGLPTKWDFLNGKSRQDVVLASLQETLNRMKKLHDGKPEDWRQSVFWRYGSRLDLADQDINRPAPPEGQYARASQYSGAGITLGYVDKAVKHNGAPGWMAIMEIGKDVDHIESLTPSGGQSWFINQWYQASPHIFDQALRYRDFDFKKVATNKQSLVNKVESTLVMTPESN